MIVPTLLRRWLELTLYPHRIAVVFGTLTVFALVPWVGSREIRGIAVVLGSLIVPSQICLVALWASLASPPFLTRIGRAALWLVGLYYCVVGAAAVNAEGFGQEFPLSLAFLFVGLFFGTIIPGQVLRQYGWRLAEGSVELVPVSIENPKPFQFHLADLLWWMTALCVFLALGAATIPRFRHDVPLHSYGPTLAEILEGSICGSACIAGPIGAIATGTFWLTMSIQDLPAAIRLAVRDPLTWIIVMWMGIISGIFICAGGPAAAAVVILIVVVVGFVGPLVGHCLLLRAWGFRLQKK